MQDRTGFDFETMGHDASAPVTQVDISSVVREGLRLAAWRDALNNYYYPLDLSTPASAFSVGHLMVYDVAEIRVGVLDSDPMTVTRRQTHIGRSDDDFFMMPITDTNNLYLTQRTRECQVRPGDLALIGTGDPYVYTQPDRTMITAVRLPAGMLRERVPWIDDMTARQSRREQPLVRMFHEFLRSVTRHGSHLSGPEATFLRHTLFDLLAHALTAPGGEVSDESSVRFANRQRILHFVEEHIADRNLSSSLIAGRLGLSPRYIQKIFAERGETVTEIIRKRRVTEAQRLLRNRNLLNKSVQEISYLAGFLDPAYFSRVFRQETSMSPGEYRRLHSDRPVSRS